MSKAAKLVVHKRKRPLLLSWIIGLAYVITLIQFGMMMLPEFRHAGLFVPALYGLLVTFTFIALVGIWHMKRWGAEMLIYTFLMREIFLSIIGEVSVPGIIFQLLLISVTLPFYKRMDRGL